jgi:hypothetical protein
VKQNSAMASKPVNFLVRMVEAISAMVAGRNEIKDRDRWDRGDSMSHHASHHKRNSRSRSALAKRKVRNKMAAKSRRVNWKRAA